MSNEGKLVTTQTEKEHLSDLSIDDLIMVVFKAAAFDTIKEKRLIPPGIMDKIVAEVQARIAKAENEQDQVSRVAGALATQLKSH